MRTAVIGAGPAGCAAAHRLRARGRDVVVFEAAAAVGGRATSWRQDGAIVDSGAGFFTNFYPTLERLIDDAGLRAAVTPLARSTSLAYQGRIVELVVGSLGSFAGFPLASASAKLRMALGTAAVALRHRGLDLSRPETLIAVDDRSIEADAVARLGREAYEFFVRPGIEPFWYFACADVSRALSLALQARAATARFFTLRDGMDSICRALVRNVEVRTAIEVPPLARHGSRLEVAGERFDDVVIATTAPAAARLIGAVDVAPELREFLSLQRYAANVHAAFVVPRASVPPAMSALFPCGPGTSPVAALSFNSHKRQGVLPEAREIVSVFLGDVESRDCLALDDAALHARAWTRARALLPSLPVDAAPFALAR